MGGWRVLRVGGVDVRADSSLLLLAALIVYNLWSFFSDPVEFPTLSGGSAAGLALLTTALFLGSILAHELAHAALFRLRGVRVLGITLHMFGGLTQGGSESRRPLDEFLVAAVGPLTTGALGAVFLLAHVAARGEAAHPVRAMFGYLALLNLAIAGFNVLPGFPLDGGRMLAAGLWKVTGSRTRALALAARAGQGVALVVGAVGLADLVRSQGRDLWGLWPVMIGVMLFQSSTAARGQAERLGRLEGVTVREVMAPPPPTIPADLPLSQARDRFLVGHEGEAFPVVEGGRVVGLISARMAGDGEREAGALVRDAMAGADGLTVAHPDEPMRAVAERMLGRAVGAVLVMREGRLVGVVESEDLWRFARRGSGRRGGGGPR
jgi:Zn-dependent protease/predicted transcriptional regulator